MTTTDTPHNGIVKKLRDLAAMKKRYTIGAYRGACEEVADLIETLTSPVEGVTFETTAEERAHWATVLATGPNWITGDQSRRLLRDFDRLTAHIATLNAALAAATEREATLAALRDAVASLISKELKSAYADERNLITRTEVIETLERIRRQYTAALLTDPVPSPGEGEKP